MKPAGKKTPPPSDSETGNETNNELVDEAVDETTALIERLQLEKDIAVNHIDSIERELSYWKEEVDRIRQQSQAGSLSNGERNRLLGQISNLRGRIARLAAQENMLDSVMSQNLAYELEMNRRTDSMARITDSLQQNVSSLTQTNDELNKKISQAGKPVFGPLRIYGIDKRKKGNRTTFDASRIEELFVEYKVIGNKLFKGYLNEELKLRVVGPGGELYLKGGDYIPQAREEDFTFLDKLEYTGASTSLKHSFKPIKKLKKGKYQVTLYENGTPVQQSSFSLY